MQVEQDPTKREIIANLNRQVFQSSNKEKLMEVFSLEDGQNWTKKPTDERRDEEHHRGTKQH